MPRHPSRISPLLLSLSLLLTASSTGDASDWPQFRGPAGGPVAAEPTPTEWDDSTRVAWTADLPGDGWSSPIVVDAKVLLTTATPTASATPGGGDYRYELHAFDLQTGAPLWSRTAVEGPPRTPIHSDNSHATETPATDGEVVIAYFGMRGCFAYDLQGEPLWQKDLGAYPMANGWGASSSPVIADGLAFLQIDNEQASHVVALDLRTGDQRWRAERPDEPSNWCTPLVWRNSNRTELVVGGKTVRSYDPATGTLLWSMPIGGRSSATASAVGDTLVIGSENRSRRGGTPGGLFAVKAGASGVINVFDPPSETDGPARGLLWANLQGAIGISSPLVHEGLVYAPARAAGVVVVHDLATGEVIEKGRVRGAGKFWSSPWAAGGSVFLLDERGETFVIDPGSELRVLSSNKLPGRFWSSPAIAGGTLLLRSESRLFAIR